MQCVTGRCDCWSDIGAVCGSCVTGWCDCWSDIGAACGSCVIGQRDCWSDIGAACGSCVIGQCDCWSDSVVQYVLLVLEAGVIVGLTAWCVMWFLYCGTV